MSYFTDNQGETWQLNLTIRKVKKLSEALGLDLLNPVHYMTVTSSITERLTFVFMLCEEQAKARDIDEDGFEERLYGENVSHEASQAFLEATKDFFTRMGQPQMSKLAQNSMAAMESGRSQLLEMESDGSLEQTIEKMMASLSAEQTGEPSMAGSASSENLDTT